MSPSIVPTISLLTFLTRQEAQRYLFFVTLGFAAWWWWRRRDAQQQRRLQPRAVSRSQVLREIAFSAASLLIFGAISLLILMLAGPSHVFFYQPLDAYGWPYLLASFFIMMLIQDTYFYWTHRLMHHRWLFRLLHHTHHRSTNPDPWSTYSINPLEAVVDSGGTVLIFVLLPKHLLVYLLFLWFNTAYAVYGHLGYEILPGGLARHALGRWINTSVAHNTHHARVRYNFGWYFLFWDRLMHTLDPDYERRYDAFTAHRSAVQGNYV